MTLIGFIRLFIKRLPWLVIFPGLLAGLVIYLTKNIPREYQSETTIYTGIASGYNITETGESRIDYFAVNNAFDNLIATVKSRETIEEVGLRLLTQHLLQEEPSLAIVNVKSLQKLNEAIPPALRKQLVVPNNFDSTYQNLNRYRLSSSTNEIALLLNNSKSHYLVTNILGNLTVQRRASSDMLELRYKSDDQGVCLQTLIFLVEVFERRYKAIKGSETTNVVKYFEEQLRLALQSLREAEERLKNFGVDNRIINYNEQSKFIAESKEDMTTDYYKEVMIFGAANAAVERLEKKLDERQILIANNTELINKRKELGEASRKLINAVVYQLDPEEVADLQYEVDVLTEEIRQLAKQYYKLNNTIDGVAQKDLLSEWLTKVLEYEESSARLTVFEKRLKEYDKIYDNFAPLGSEITRLARGVDVAEKEYLSVLHGLNLAKLRQQNLQMANSLTIMDEPYLPLIPQSSKRPILVIAAFMAGFILLLAFFVANEMLDYSMRTPERAVKASELTLAGALPAYKKRSNVKLEQVEHSLTEQLVTSITIALRNAEKVSTYYQINVLSARKGEGKTWFCQRMANRFAQIEGNVLHLYPESSELGDIESPDNVISIPYKVDGSLAGKKGIQDLLEGSGHSSFEFTYVFLELPFLSDNSVPFDLASQAHISLLVLNAENNWASAHERALGLYQKAAAKNKTMLVLNRVTPEMLESIYGEIPKRRSPLRRLVKKMVSMGAI
jgi:polysaccharide biosynthesis transport protein